MTWMGTWMVGLAMLSAAVDSAAADCRGPVEEGSVSIEFGHGQGELQISLAVDVPGAVGAVVATDQGPALVAFQVAEPSAEAESVLEAVASDSRLKVGASSLTGLRPSVAIARGMAGAGMLAVFLVADDGGVRPFRLQVSDLASLKRVRVALEPGTDAFDLSWECPGDCRVSAVGTH
jgi:hypothetical protein